MIGLRQTGYLKAQCAVSGSLSNIAGLIKLSGGQTAYEGYLKTSSAGFSVRRRRSGSLLAI
ncbi:hypothetical protein [Neisseria shayeganii]|uniref:Uncharacterized protein n=1 Tax=Neisseria shayeganii TaxID=607712 RepID=A0A7D7NBS4_9NEIS|nr:hypothetical protein [Neisseria shayeganii]QMT40815.1 hypothetical protein H3L94_01785 [Neisseria shayeganii]